jgi:DNA repair photolyase
MEIKAVTCKSALNKIKGNRLPFRWDLNIYRGCGHGCKYCYALYSHDYLEEDNFYNTIYYKENIVEVLRKELQSPTWKKQVINFGGVTDSYQPLEKKIQLMPELLKLMIEFQNPITISTKSDLIVRDIDLINELSQVAEVNVALTITCMDEKIRRVIEPGATPSLQRFQALNELSKTKSSRGVHFMPIIPHLTDTDENFDEILRFSRDIKADYVLPGMLYLRGKTRKSFYQFYEKYDAMRCRKLKDILYNKEKKIEYSKDLYQRLNSYYKKYGIKQSNSNRKIKEMKKDYRQIELNID